MSERVQAADRALRLREAFDRAFAAPPRAAETENVELLAIRIGTGRYALRLADIRGIFPDKKIVAVPARGAELLGVASFRGAIVPVYGLHILLGIAGNPDPRWLAIAHAGNVALAFDELETHLRVPPEAVEDHGAGHATQRHIGGFLRVGGFVRGVIDVASLAAAIGLTAPARE